MAPKWDPRNLTRHHRKRTTEDAGCFEDLLKLPAAMSPEQYELRSDEAVTNAWGKYEGEDHDDVLKCFRDTAMYFVDEELVVAITDAWEREFVTCFHKHYSRIGLDHTEVMAMSVGRRIILYQERLKLEVLGKYFRGLKWHRNV
jgi:hypothetical protein